MELCRAETLNNTTLKRIPGEGLLQVSGKQKSFPAELPLLPIFFLLIIIGILARFVGLGHRSLWIDEAWVVNLIEAPKYLTSILHDKEPYWSPLPLLFVISTRAMIALFGNSEAVFRLLPCLFGIGTLAVLSLLSREVFERSRLWMIAPTILALHPVAIYYSKELKQFSGEMFFSAMLIYIYVLAVKKKSSANLLSIFFLSVAFVGIGFGIPLVLLVMSESVLLGLWFYRQRTWKPLALLAAGVLFIGVTEGLQYFLWLRPQIDPTYVTWWDAIVFPPHHLPEIPSWLINRGFSFFSYEFGFPTALLGERLVFRGEFPLAYLAFLTCCLGIFFLFFDKRRDLVYLYFLTILSLIVLAFLGKWPLGGSRVNLFLMPFHLIFIACGIGTIASLLAKRLPKPQIGWGIGALCVLAALPLQSLDENLWRLKEREEMKPVVESVKDQFDPQKERIFVYYYAKEAFQHYWGLDHRYQDPNLYYLALTPEGSAAQVDEILTYCKSFPESVEGLYLVLSHIRQAHKKEILDLCRKEFGPELNSKEVTGASVYLFRIRERTSSV